MTPRAFIASVLLAACASATIAKAEVLVTMDRATQQRLGLREAPLAGARQADGTSGFARGLDLTPLATLEADLSAGEAAARASAAEAARTAGLAKADATVSRKVAEAAAAQARADGAKLVLLRRRIGLEWGPALGAMPDARRTRLVSAVSAGRAALVRIDLIGAGARVSGAADLDLGPHGHARAAVLGPARTADPRSTAPGLLAVVEGPAASWVGTGTAIPVSLVTNAPATGVVIPREALLRTAGQTFAYVRRGDDQFERRPVTAGLPRPNGLFAPRGFQPGESVVVSGAAKLFAAEKTPTKAD